MEENIDLKLSIDELRGLFNRQYSIISITRDIAKTILGSTSVIVSIVITLTTIRQTSLENIEIYNIVALIAGVLFILLIGITVYLLMPSPLLGPIKPSAAVLENFYVDKPSRAVMLQLISAYLNIIGVNEKTIKKRNIETWVMGVLMMLIILCMIGLIQIR